MTPISRRVFAAGLPASLMVPIAAGAQQTPQTAVEAPLLYYSDYYSFVGRDATGYVYLAHDNNRGRTGERYFADHWIAMYDDATGWVDIKGSAHYPNPEKVLDYVPASEHFSITGKPESGITMLGPSNDIKMVVDPLPRTLYRENVDGIFWIGGAPAVLQWKGRTLQGRVVFEYLQRHNWNRFTANFGANWQNFNGLYLMTSTGADFYVHFHERQGGSELNGKLVGMASWGTPAPVTNLKFQIPRTVSVPWRSYRCPSKWLVEFEHGGKAWRLDLDTSHRATIADWEKGGFFMVTAEGRIVAQDGSEGLDVVGWAELLL